MPYVITNACIGEKDGACVDSCPVDCIYEGRSKRYIHPEECIECGACVPECPVDAILSTRDLTEPTWAVDNAEFFSLPLPGLDKPIGDPGGASVTGPIDADTPLVAGWTKE